MSFMRVLAKLTTNPQENKDLFYKIFLVLGVTLLLFTLLHADDVVRVLVITVCALYLFTTEKLPVEVTALSIMVVLMIFGLVSPSVGVSGFSNSATITVLAMFILSAGIQKTGIIHTLGNYVFKFAGNSEFRQILAIGLIVGPISGFINNTAAVAIMLPMVLDLAKKAETSSTKLLIPLSYIAMAGGTFTLIGTSTNILAASIYAESGYGTIGLFDFAKLGFIVLLITLFFMAIFGRWLLPARKNKSGTDNFSLESNFLAELEVEKGSSLIGKSLKKSRFLDNHDCKLIKLIRNDLVFRKDAVEKIVEEGDILVIFANQQRISELDKNEKEGVKLLLDFDEGRRRFASGTGQIVKVMVRSSNIFHKRSLHEINFWKRFGAAVVGINREDVISKRLANLKLETGEILLIKVSKSALEEISDSNDILIVEMVKEEFNREKMWLALLIIFSVIFLSAVGIPGILEPMPIMITALAGVILMILTGCLKAKDLQTAVSWDVIFLLAGVIPLGIAMQTSGAAELISHSLAGLGTFMLKGSLIVGGIDVPALVLLMFFYLITTLITEIISNNAAVVLIVPVAISVAEKLSLNPYVFVLAVMFAASTSFLTPIGYQTNTMVYGAGNYKFSDFLKVGAPLNFILSLVTPILIAYFWGF